MISFITDEFAFSVELLYNGHLGVRGKWPL